MVRWGGSEGARLKAADCVRGSLFASSARDSAWAVGIMVYGLWFMVYGLWFMVHGLWFMVYGLRFTVYGLWFILYLGGAAE